MLNTDYIEKLLGMKDIILSEVSSTDTELHIHFSLKHQKQTCPCCKQKTSYIHDYRIQTFKGAPINGLHTYFYYRKRRYRCPHCSKRFYEDNDFLSRYLRISNQLIFYILDQMRFPYAMSHIAAGVNLSISTIFRIFRFLNHSKPSMPNVLSIDEFKGNAGRKFQGILTDPKHKRVLDILPGRESHILVSYFRQFHDCANVKYFVMDMWRPYKEIAETYFKNAIIVIDKYHFIRQITWAFDRIRKQEQKKLSDYRRKYFKKSRFLLLKRASKLTQEETDQVSIMLSLLPRLGTAYLLKEKFYDFVDASDKKDAIKKLKDWYIYVEALNEPEFTKAMHTIINWQEYILNSFDCPYTNGYTEGVNNKIKVLKRNAYGVRNFERFRTRILHMMA